MKLQMPFSKLFMLFLFFYFALNSAFAEGTKKIFILHSYELNHVCGKPQSLGVQSALIKAGYGIDDLKFESYAMDTKRTNNTQQLIAQQAKIALQKISQFKPDVLVTLDDNAFRTVALELVDTDIQIVFSGMNNIPERYNKVAQWMNDMQVPGHNITGVYEKIHFSTAVKVQKNIQSKLNKIRIISDNSPTGKALIRQVKDELIKEPIPAEADFFITDSWEEYQQKILESNQSDIDTLYPIALRLIDKNGQTYTAAEILSWTGKHSNIPSIPLNFAFVKLGLLGGAGVDFESMGYQAGEIVAKILAGKSAGEIPVQDAKRYALVFNINRAKDLGIDIPSDILLAADEVYQ